MSITTSDDLPAKPAAESVRNLPDGCPAADSVKKRRRPPATDGSPARRSLPYFWTMALALLLLLPGGCSAPPAVDNSAQEVSQVTTAATPEMPATDSASSPMAASPTPVVPTATPTTIPTEAPTEVAEVGAGETEEVVAPGAVLPASPVPASPVPPSDLTQRPDIPLETPTMVPPVPYESPEITNKWEAFPRRVEQAYVLQYEGTGPEAGISFPIEIGVSLSNTPWGLQRFSFEYSEFFIQKYGTAYLEVAHHKYNQQHPDDKISYEQYLNKVRAGEGQYFYNYYNQLPNGKFEVAEGRATVDPRDGVAIGLEFVDDRPIFTPGGPTLEQKAAKWPKRSSLSLRPFDWVDFRLNQYGQPMIVTNIGADSFADKMQKLLRKNDLEEINMYWKRVLSTFLTHMLQFLLFQRHLAQNNRGYLEHTVSRGGGAAEMRGNEDYPSYDVYNNAMVVYFGRPDLVIDESIPRSTEQYRRLHEAQIGFLSEWNTATDEELLGLYSIFVRVIVGN